MSKAKALWDLMRLEHGVMLAAQRGEVEVLT